MTKCLFALALTVFLCEKARLFKPLVFCLIITCIPQIGTGLLQKLTGSTLGLTILGELPGSNYTYQTASGSITRIAGIIGSHNHLALFLGMVIPLNLSLLFSPALRSWRWFFFCPVLAFSYLLDLFTYSRGGWFSLFIGSATVIYFAVLNTLRRPFLLAIIIIAGSGLFGILLISSIPTMRHRIFSHDNGSSFSRIELGYVALNMISHKPITGVGFGNFVFSAPHYDRTFSAISRYFTWPPHNEYLLIASEGGLISLGLYSIIILILFIRLIRIIRNPLYRGHFNQICAIGFLGGIITMSLHLVVEFIHVMSWPFFWVYIGLCISAGRTALYRASGTMKNITDTHPIS